MIGQKSAICNEQTHYINARFESSKIQYAAIISLLFIGPLGLVYAFIGLLTSQDFNFNGLVKAMLVITSLALIGVAIIFKGLKKYWVFRIITDDSGITYIGLFRKIFAHWSEVNSVEVASTGVLFGGKMIAVTTRPGSFYFPLTMKKEGKEYPKLDSFGEKWVEPNGDKRPITLENCSLYAEITHRKGQ